MRFGVLAISLFLGWSSMAYGQCYVLYPYNCSDDYTKSCDDGAGSCSAEGEICATESQPEGTFNGYTDAISGESGQTEITGGEMSCGTHRSCSCREYWYDPDEEEGTGDEYSELICELNTWWPWWNMPGYSYELSGDSCTVDDGGGEE